MDFQELEFDFVNRPIVRPSIGKKKEKKNGDLRRVHNQEGRTQFNRIWRRTSKGSDSVTGPGKKTEPKKYIPPRRQTGKNRAFEGPGPLKIQIKCSRFHRQPRPGKGKGTRNRHTPRGGWGKKKKAEKKVSLPAAIQEASRKKSKEKTRVHRNNTV